MRCPAGMRRFSARRRSSWTRPACGSAGRRTCAVWRCAARAAGSVGRGPPRVLRAEPLDSLDLPNQAAVAALVSKLCTARGVGALLVAHDVNPLLPFIDRVVYLAGGHALQGSVDEVITSETL